MLVDIDNFLYDPVVAVIAANIRAAVAYLIENNYLKPV